MQGHLTRSISIATLLIAGAAALAGCATAPRPLSIEEAIWFDKATGDELIQYNPPYLFAPFAASNYQDEMARAALVPPWGANAGVVTRR